MIPQFPEFKKLQLTDKDDVESYTKKFPPYSDFNFVSMWSWDIKGESRIAQLNGNLIVKFNDYLTGEAFFSFLGINKVNETAKQLLGASKILGIEPKLRLIPEEVIKKIDKNKFIVIEDRDNFDYILDLTKLSDHKGSDYGPKRRLISKLFNEHVCQTIVIEKLDIDSAKLIHDMVEEIEGEKKSDVVHSSVRRELDAVKRVLNLENTFNLLVICVYVDGKLCGFSTKELIDNEYCIGHFLKAKKEFSSSVYSYLMQQQANILLEKGCKYINIEQDMGIPGLRFWKEKHSPSHFLKKYKVVEI